MTECVKKLFAEVIKHFQHEFRQYFPEVHTYEPYSDERKVTSNIILYGGFFNTPYLTEKFPTFGVLWYYSVNMNMEAHSKNAFVRLIHLNLRLILVSHTFTQCIEWVSTTRDENLQIITGISDFRFFPNSVFIPDYIIKLRDKGSHQSLHVTWR